MNNIVYNRDCLEAMREMEDNAFDLAVVDPPYGISYARGKNGYGVCSNRPNPSDLCWDKIPDKEYFDELFRVSKNAIIWGGNYFTHLIPPSKCWIVWNKIGTTENKSPYSDCELAWTSFKKNVKMFTLRQMGFISDSQDKERIHPTQKPTELYDWIFKTFAKPDMKVLDTHIGSGSSRIAAYKAGLDFVGYEIDKDYYEAQERRFQNALNGTDECGENQLKLF